MIRFLSLIFICLYFGVTAQAQQGQYSISGTVKDKKGETLPGAGIYLSGYTIATVADNNGKFNLPRLKPGSYEVVVQMIGYLPYSKSVIISDKSVDIIIILSENTIQLNEVVIRADPDRPKNLKIFTDFFIGKTPNSAQCKILNPNVLFIKYDKDTKILSVTTNEFLIVENKALGYQLKYMLTLFEYDYNTRIISFSGLPVFEDLKGSAKKKKEWLARRETAYYGSPQHFFQSLYRNNAGEEGFIIYKRVRVKNPNRPDDTVLNAMRTRLLGKAPGSVIRSGSVATDSLSIVQKLYNLPKEYLVLDTNAVHTDTLVKYFDRNRKTINFKDELYVMYTREQESNAYSLSGHYIMRPLFIPNHQVSVIRQMSGAFSFYPNGAVHDNKSVLYEGFWAYEKIGDMIPIDYIPQSKR